MRITRSTSRSAIIFCLVLVLTACVVESDVTFVESGGDQTAEQLAEVEAFIIANTRVVECTDFSTDNGELVDVEVEFVNPLDEGIAGLIVEIELLDAFGDPVQTVEADFQFVEPGATVTERADPVDPDLFAAAPLEGCKIVGGLRL